MNKFKSFLSENIVLLDGGMGTLLQARGLAAGEFPERWNLSHPDVIREVHRDYFDAGSNVVCTNTFGANLLKFSKEELEKGKKELDNAYIELKDAEEEFAEGYQQKLTLTMENYNGIQRITD